MFQNILLPVDLADRHAAAFDMVAQLASPDTATVTLLHVIETITEISSGEERDFYNLLEANARTFLEKLGKRLADRGIAARAKIVFGHRAADTVRFAIDMPADLIILTAPRIDPANPGASWGSLSFKISFLSPCPVLMVK